MNCIIKEFMNKEKTNTLSVTSNKEIVLSKNIIDLDPVPMYIREIENFGNINSELENISQHKQYKEGIYIDKTQEPDKKSTVFSSQNAYVPYNNILSLNSTHIDELKLRIIAGIKELMMLYYDDTQRFQVNITNSWMQKYRDGTFLSPHNHLTGCENPNNFYFSCAYYIDNGDPDLTQSYNGCITFINNEKLFHVRPKPGLLLIWNSNLIHLVNPFTSKSNKDRFMLSCNITVELIKS